jgi:Fe2+ transport system protein B
MWREILSILASIERKSKQLDRIEESFDKHINNFKNETFSIKSKLFDNLLFTILSLIIFVLVIFLLFSSTNSKIINLENEIKSLKTQMEQGRN